jgi:hypothetical protein
MAKYLVVKNTYFVDPHGTPDHGGVEKFITENDKYETTPDDMYIQGDEPVTEDDLWGSEDGYNARAYDYSVREITDEEAVKIQAIIDAYNALY